MNHKLDKIRERNIIDNKKKKIAKIITCFNFEARGHKSGDS